MSRATCNFFFDKVAKLVGGGSVINGATPSSFLKYRWKKKRKNALSYSGNLRKNLFDEKSPSHSRKKLQQQDRQTLDIRWTLWPID